MIRGLLAIVITTSLDVIPLKAEELYQKRDTWPATMLATRERCLEWIKAGQSVEPVMNTWNQIERDYPIPIRWIKRDMPDGKYRTWMSATDTQIEQAMIPQVLGILKINYDTTRQQQEFDALCQANAPANDPRWMNLYASIADDVYGKRIGRETMDANGPPPYVIPRTPETRTLTSEEAQRVLENDYLFQVNNAPTRQSARNEIGWARAIAARLAINPKTPDIKADLAELDSLEKQVDQIQDTSPTAITKLYFAVRKVKRTIMFKNPAIDFDKILLIDNPYPAGREWPHQSVHRNGFHAVPGGRLLILEGLNPGGKVTRLAPDKPGSFVRPDLSFDAKKVLFSFVPHNDDAYHLYEMNIDGTGLQQLTDGLYDDLDPIHLPDGHILFSSGRCHTYVRCLPDSPSFIISRCDADGKNIYIISCNNEPEYLPSLLHDGRIIYSRWEYTDKSALRVQKLWSMNPDGTGVATFWGNQSVWPDHLAEPREIPGSHRIMFTGVGHHNWFEGCIGIIDQSKGFNFPNGLTKVTQELAWPEVGNGPVDPVETTSYHACGRYDSYKTPYPLSTDDFLVSARHDDKFRLYLMDLQGNRDLIYDGVYHIFYGQPLRPRTPPPVIADRVVWPGTGPDRIPVKPGVMYNANVFEGSASVMKDKAKYLRVLQIDAKSYTTWHKTYNFSGPSISILQADGVKRILGTVPIEPDGSVAFYVPACRTLHLQLLDDQFRALQSMRTFTGVMPDEKCGCVGCHEQQGIAASTQAGLAMKSQPRELTPPPWGAETTIGYERFVQPVLDQYCGKCHQGNGKGKEKIDLTLRDGNGQFKEPYITLVGGAFGWCSPVSGPTLAGCLRVEGFNTLDPASLKTIPPMTMLSCKSQFIDIAMSGKHHDVKVTGDDLQKLIAWVDANCPYLGDEEIRQMPDPQFDGIEQLSIPPRMKTAPVIERP